METEPNVTQAVPFFWVQDIENSVRFYVDGLGFHMVRHWSPGGRLVWCWLELGTAAVMLQEFLQEGHDAYRPQGKVGDGVSIYCQCRDALAIYREVIRRGIQASKPVVGNGFWVTYLHDPDGYRLEFESPTGQPEETEYIADEIL
jgi:catechol 2,3-dioxygenase-like lactoylglutathione lyase family enzyme